MINASLQHIQSLRTPSGLFRASKADVSTGYNKSWIRDNVYTLLGLEAVSRIEDVVVNLQRHLDILIKHQDKIDWAIREKPQHRYQYIHARYHPDTLEEFHEEWGNKQNDAIGALLWKIGDLERKGVRILRDDVDRMMLQKVVMYLVSIEYWQDPDNGMWEDNEEIHASSIGACVAGLEKVKGIVMVPQWLITAGKEALWKLLPKESHTRKLDLALLSLIYPYNVVDKRVRDCILRNVEEHLVRERGVIRHIGDWYHNRDGEAEWTMGFAWLAIIYKQIGNTQKYQHYLAKTRSVMNSAGELPELYYARSSEHNENTPLAWAQSLHIVAEV
ncbi:glycoside hydrolase family 15 [Candidatus Woesearchaeota archaeon]|nr:glycoside hydrolase family 15 [Candidatus Woesearchaeota archaeon]